MTPWREEALDGTSEDEQQHLLAQILDEERTRRFDMAQPPLLRFTLVRLATERHVLVMTNHHIVVDGWSWPLLVRDLLELYAQDGDATALPAVVPFRDYLGWVAAQDRQAAESAWQSALAGLEGPTWSPPEPGATVPIRFRSWSSANCRRRSPPNSTRPRAAAD